MRLPVLALLVLPLGLTAQEVTGPPGPRRLLDRDHEVALARSAAPASVSAEARIWYFDRGYYVVADSGANEVECYVSRSWPASLEPHCLDAEGARTIMRLEMRGVELAHDGVSREEAARELAAGIANGTYQLPSRPAMSWMMSSAQELIGDDGQAAGAWKPHLMIYYPYLTATGTGLAGNDLAAGILVDAGTPKSNLMIVVPTAVDPLPPGGGTR
jgi:hypothetical protein